MSVAVTRSKLSLGALCLLVITSSYHCVTRLRDSASRFIRRPKVDDVTRFEMRFEPAKKILLLNRYERVGYLTDELANADWFGDYFQTQYSLAPVIINNSANFPVVVTNLHDLTLTNQLVQSTHPLSVVDCGNGVLLLKRPQ